MELLTYFSDLKAKQQRSLRDMSYNILTNNMVIPMFNHNTDKNINSEIIERFLVTTGMVSFGYADGAWHPFDPSFNGKIGPDGLGINIFGTSIDNYYFSGSREDFPVMFNNSMYVGEWDVLTRVADALSQTSISMMSNVKLCRAKASILAATEQEKNQANQIVQDIEDGKLLTVLLDKMKAASGGNSGYEFMNLGDIKDIDKLQYLTKFFDDVVRMTMQLYGIPINSSGKMAQMNDMELNGYQLYSRIYPNDRLRMRQRFYEEFNKRYSLNWSVEFNDPWNSAMADIQSEESIGKELSEEGSAGSEDSDNENDEEGDKENEDN